MDPASRQEQDLDRLVADLAERVPGVLHALVMSSDGVPLAGSDQMQSEQLHRLSAISAGLLSLARGAARIWACGAVTQALVVMEGGTLIVMAIDDAASLAVLTSAADLDAVAYEMTMLAERVGTEVTPAARVVRDPPGTARFLPTERS